MVGRRRCESSGDLNLVARRYNLRIDEKQNKRNTRSSSNATLRRRAAEMRAELQRLGRRTDFLDRAAVHAERAGVGAMKAEAEAMTSATRATRSDCIVQIGAGCKPWATENEWAYEVQPVTVE